MAFFCFTDNMCMCLYDYFLEIDALALASNDYLNIPPGFHSQIVIQPDGNASLVKAIHDSVSKTTASVVSAADILLGKDDEDEDEEVKVDDKEKEKDKEKDKDKEKEKDQKEIQETNNDNKENNVSQNQPVAESNLDAMLKLPSENELSAIHLKKKDTVDTGGETWAIAIDISAPVENFEEKVPDMAYKVSKKKR